MGLRLGKSSRCVANGAGGVCVLVDGGSLNWKFWEYREGGWMSRKGGSY